MCNKIGCDRAVFNPSSKMVPESTQTHVNYLHALLNEYWNCYDPEYEADPMLDAVLGIIQSFEALSLWQIARLINLH